MNIQNPVFQSLLYCKDIFPAQESLDFKCTIPGTRGVLRQGKLEVLLKPHRNLQQEQGLILIC